MKRMAAGSDLLRLDEQVLWLDVPMDYVVPVAVLEGLEQLVDVVTHLVELQAVRVLL